MAAPSLTNFVPVPRRMFDQMIEGLAGIPGKQTLAAKAFILTKVSRKDGWQGLALDEFVVSPKELASAVHCSSQYASRILQVLKQDGWCAATVRPGVMVVVRAVAYTDMPAVCTRKTQVVESQKDTHHAQPLDVMPPVVVDVTPLVMPTVMVDVMPPGLKPNGGADPQAPQESNTPKVKNQGFFSSSGEADEVPTEEEFDHFGEPTEIDILAAFQDELLSAWNEKAPGCGLKEVSRLTSPQRELATCRFSEGVTLLDVQDAMLRIASFGPGWWAEHQPDYNLEKFLAPGKIEEFAAAYRKESSKKPRKVAGAVPPPAATNPAATAPATNGDPWQALEDLLGPEGFKSWQKLYVAYGNPARVNPLVDALVAESIVGEGNFTWDDLIYRATAQAEAADEPRFIPAMAKWFAERRFRVVASKKKKPKSTNPRAGSDEAYGEARKAAMAAPVPAAAPPTPATEPGDPLSAWC